MIKSLLLSLLTLTCLQAKVINPDDLSDIYIEAILFVTVFTLLSIISYIYSKKHAKQYAKENPSSKQDVPETSKESDEAISADHTVTVKNETDRLMELSKMLKNGLITEEEFQLLKQKSIS
ncbi:MAG: SHOCT domain-containing protein [Campylobacterota bacterium]|nr:SHOCT domain-containing protein [Campylobacterota bacterium]